MNHEPQFEPYNLYAENEYDFNDSLDLLKRLPKPTVDNEFLTKHSVPSRHCLNAKAMRRICSKPDNVGSQWFNMESKEITEDLKFDLLAMQYGRQAHPSVFYKKPDEKGLPKYFQIGYIKDNRRLKDSVAPKRRKSPVKSFLQQLNEDEKWSKYIKKSYHEHKEKEKRKRMSMRRRPPTKKSSFKK